MWNDFIPIGEFPKYNEYYVLRNEPLWIMTIVEIINDNFDVLGSNPIESFFYVLYCFYFEI